MGKSKSWIPMSGQFVVILSTNKGGDVTLDVFDIIKISIWRSDHDLCQ